MRPAVVAGANEYRLLERVATTALGSVHRALHVSTGRLVEVRLLQRLADDPGGRAAFAEALPAIAALRHRGILPVEAWGDTDGVPSVVSPLPDAEPLADRLAAARLPDRASALRLLREVAAAVDHAHRLGVTHGDLEPAAVLVTADGSAIVAHFGLAHLAGAPLPGGTGLRHGSPAHVAPERFPAGLVGPAADVYAFAVIAWQLLTGRLPGDGALAEPVAAVLRRGMHRAPERRWASCGALMDALEAALAGDPGPAAAAAPAASEPPQPAGRLAGIPARTWLAAVCGLLLLGVLGGVIVSGERPGAGAPTSSRARAADVTVTAAATPPPAVTEAPSPSPTPAPTATPSVAPVPAATVRPTPSPTPTASATPSPTATGLSVTVSDSNPRPGEQNVMVTGHGFDPRQQYVIYFYEVATGLQQLFGPASPNGSGDFSSPVRIPTGARPGTALLAGCVYLTSRCATVQVTVRG